MGNSGYPIPVGRREEIFTAEDAEGAETKTEGKRERIGDGRLIASLVFSAFFSAFSASSAVRNEWIAEKSSGGSRLFHIRFEPQGLGEDLPLFLDQIEKGTRVAREEKADPNIEDS